MGTAGSSPKKVLVMTFDDSFLPKLGRTLLNTSIEIKGNIGFCNHMKQSINTIFTFLSAQMRKIWIHHYIGTHGIVMIYEGDDIESNLNEIMSILKNDALIQVPLLLLLNKTTMMNSIDYITKLREELLSSKINFKVQYVNFDNMTNGNELLYGIDWLEEQINDS